MRRASRVDMRTVRQSLALSQPLILFLIALAVRRWIVNQLGDSCALRHLESGRVGRASWHSANARVWATQTHGWVTAHPQVNRRAEFRQASRSVSATSALARPLHRTMASRQTCRAPLSRQPRHVGWLAHSLPLSCVPDRRTNGASCASPRVPVASYSHAMSRLT